MSHSDLTRARVFLEVRTRSLYRPGARGKKNLIGFSPLQGRPHRLGAEGLYGLSWMTKAGRMLAFCGGVLWWHVRSRSVAFLRAQVRIFSRGRREADSN